MSKTEMSGIVVDLSKKVEAALNAHWEADSNLPEDTAITIELPEKLYWENLPEGLTKENVLAVRKYDHTFQAAVVLGAGTFCNGKDNVDTATVEVGTQGQNFSVAYRRNDTVSGGVGKPRQEAFGTVRTRRRDWHPDDARGARVDYIDQAQTQVQEQALAKFGSKAEAALA